MHNSWKNWVLCLIIILPFSDINAQKEDKPADNLTEYQAIYAERIKQTHLSGVYIPANLDEAFTELVKLSPNASIASYQEAPESLVIEKLFYSLGRWMIYNWGFYEGSRLSHSLREQGIYHPDDMARLIMTSFHRHLNNKPLELETQIASIKERVRLEEEERRKNAKVIHEERRPSKESKED